MDNIKGYLYQICRWDNADSDEIILLLTKSGISKDQKNWGNWLILSSWNLIDIHKVSTGWKDPTNLTGNTMWIKKQWVLTFQ